MPANAAHPRDATAFHRPDRRPSNTHGISATVQEKFGKLPLDSTGPDHRERRRADEGGERDIQRRSHSHIPAANSGNGAATQRVEARDVWKREPDERDGQEEAGSARRPRRLTGAGERVPPGPFRAPATSGEARDGAAGRNPSRDRERRTRGRSRATGERKQRDHRRTRRPPAAARGDADVLTASNWISQVCRSSAYTRAERGQEILPSAGRSRTPRIESPMVRESEGSATPAVAHCSGETGRDVGELGAVLPRTCPTGRWRSSGCR